MEIEEALKILNADREAFININHGGFTNKIKAFEMAIGTLEKQKTNDWIPCKERLPHQRQYENGEPIEYAITLEGATSSTTGVIDESGIWGDMNWYRGEFIPFETKVVAWMDMPEVCKEESNEK